MILDITPLTAFDNYGFPIALLIAAGIALWRVGVWLAHRADKIAGWVAKEYDEYQAESKGRFNEILAEFKEFRSEFKSFSNSMKEIEREQEIKLNGHDSKLIDHDKRLERLEKT